RNVACTGAVPLGITDNLNFGNPQKPEVYHQFKEACRGIGDACRAFETPVTGGNVSFYNESPTGAVYPTPTVGMVGLLERVDRRVPSFFSTEGDVILVLGRTTGVLGGSAYWAELRDFVGGQPDRVDLEAERRLQQFLVACARQGLLRSAHDCSDGGLAVTLAESAMGGPYAAGAVGADLDLTGYADGVDAVGLLYGEDAGRVVVSADPSFADVVLALASRHGVPAFVAGRVGAPGGALTVRRGDERWSWPTPALRRTYFDAIPRRMAAVATDRDEGA
ncbi:MAG TPA: AIR synthase-related protein, partial [Gemmatimonadales bacterium]|nr:AIR synthase-related protein [Gemmatimonadales bacterium]